MVLQWIVCVALISILVLDAKKVPIPLVLTGVSLIQYNNSDFLFFVCFLLYETTRTGMKNETRLLSILKPIPFNSISFSVQNADIFINHFIPILLQNISIHFVVHTCTFVQHKLTFFLLLFTAYCVLSNNQSIIIHITNIYIESMFLNSPFLYLFRCPLRVCWIDFLWFSLGIYVNT